ncbi:DUF92 domain-containing protein [Priestia megaterium]|uniref:DUF92 domain-containing protein n=1 Tax=Priestia megaterium TaxID=1404 RepID=UPI001ADF87E5|nr:DUF92 domain-containing protein [Priestia megaterium]
MNPFDVAMIIVILLMAGTGYWAKALTVSGACMSFIVGASVYIGFSLQGFLLLLLFFSTSTLCSKYKKEKKRGLEEKLEKHDRRDYIQVLANGGVAAACSLLYAATASPVCMWMFMISISAANADTWASEIGSLSKRPPFYIWTLKRVEAGTSGAVSLLGTAAGAAGAFLIAAACYFAFPYVSLSGILLVGCFGFIGNAIDTLLGASVQVRFRCQSCGIETERKEHCRKPTIKEKGIIFFNNDVVNLASILLAAFTGGILILFLPI